MKHQGKSGREIFPQKGGGGGNPGPAISTTKLFRIFEEKTSLLSKLL